LSTPSSIQGNSGKVGVRTSSPFSFAPTQKSRKTLACLSWHNILNTTPITARLVILSLKSTNPFEKRKALQNLLCKSMLVTSPMMYRQF
jgi:hypothetical protein